MDKTLNELLEDICLKQKKGLPFILASTCIWLVISVIAFLPLELLARNIATLSCGAMMFPLSFLWSKILKVDLFCKDNALVKGLIIATNNQILYIFICIILMIKAPNLVLPSYALIYGAHLLPYSFFYHSKAYQVLSGLICVVIMIALVFLRLDVRLVPVIVEISVIGLAFLLWKELKQIKV